MGKETKMTWSKNGIPAELLQATHSLTDNVLQSEPFLRLKAEEDRLSEDPEAQRLLAELSEVEEKIRTAQFSAGVAASDLTRLRTLQNAVALNETIQAHGMAREFAIAFLREINTEISNLLGVDFASLTRRASGCC